MNPAAFSTPASGTFGDLGRNAYRAPAISDVDFALAKNVVLAERVQLRFRADVFNILNRAQYGAPNAVRGQSNFGIVTPTVSSDATGRGTPREFQLWGRISFLGRRHPPRPRGIQEPHPHESWIYAVPWFTRLYKSGAISCRAASTCAMLRPVASSNLP